ncbi:MAG: glycosyltransferase [Bacteroidales bacterium]|nr:glycosyltransferase [Bacteroidales bacterium]
MSYIKPEIISLGPAWPYRGGLASFNDRLARQFTDEGNKIEIITFRLQYPRILFPGKTQYTESTPPEGIHITRLINSINPLNWIATGLKIKRAKPDILLIRYWLPFMGPCLGTISRIAKSNNHTLVICIFDNVIPHEKRPGDKLLTKYFTGGIDAAIVMSGSVKEELLSFRPDIPVSLSPHPLFDNYGIPVSRDQALSALNLGSENNYLLFFGFIRAYKGLDLLIKAFADKRLRKKKLKLIIAGEFYEDDTPYRQLVKLYDLENDVIFHDHFIKDSEVPLYFGVADLVIQPYKSATQSGVTQIAFHYDKPMLVTEVGGLKEIVTDGVCGYVVPPTPEDISESILDFFENRRQEQFIEGVRIEKEKFTWDKMTESITGVYNKCIELRKSAGD